MSDHSDLGLRLERLESAVQEISDRVGRLERTKAATSGTATLVAAPPRSAAPAPVQKTDLSVDMALAGMSVLILGGGFLLRALTESAALPPIGGVIAGLAYAAFWAWKADRAARADRHRAAAFHAATASVIAFPLAWETTTRFKILSPELGALVVAVLALVLLWIATRENIQSVAWIANAGAIGAAIAIGSATGTLVPVMHAITLVGAATLYASYRLGWSWIAWPAAIVSDGLAFITLGTAAFRHNGYDFAIVAASLSVYSATWLLVVASRRVRLNETPSMFDIIQTTEALIVGIGGATYVASVNDAGTLGLGIPLLFGAAGAYAVSFARQVRKTGGLRAWFGAVGAFFFACATWLIIDDASIRGIAWAIAGVFTAELGRTRSFAIRLQSAIWIVLAAIGGGLALATLGALIEPKPEGIAAPPAAMLIAVLALVAFVRMPRTEQTIRALLLCVVTCGAYTAAAAASVHLIAPAEQAGVALIRTVTLAIIATALAFISRATGTREAAIVARAVLVVGGIKLLAEDVRVGRAAMLVAAFAAYGGAMLLVSRTSATPPHPLPAAGERASEVQ